MIELGQLLYEVYPMLDAEVHNRSIHGYLNPSIQEKAEYLMEEREILLNNPL